MFFLCVCLVFTKHDSTVFTFILAIGVIELSYRNSHGIQQLQQSGVFVGGLANHRCQ